MHKFINYTLGEGPVVLSVLGLIIYEMKLYLLIKYVSGLVRIDTNNEWSINIQSSQM